MLDNEEPITIDCRVCLKAFTFLYSETRNCPFDWGKTECPHCGEEYTQLDIVILSAEKEFAAKKVVATW